MALQLGSPGGLSAQSSALYSYHGEDCSQRAMSLPSSPRQFKGQASERSNRLDRVTTEMTSTWNKILECHSENNKPLIPYPEWNIDFSELTVGTRVGIGKLSPPLPTPRPQVPSAHMHHHPHIFPETTLFRPYQ